LLECRATSAVALAEAVGLAAARLDAVIAGSGPDESLLRRLAPALGLHASDLFVFAARTVPVDLAPPQLTGPLHVGLLTPGARYLGAEARARSRRFVDDLPVRTVHRTRPFPSDGREATCGTILLRLLATPWASTR
jgi:hypothetical protein